MQESELELNDRSKDADESWRKASIISVITLVILFIAYWATLQEIIGIWLRSETFTHGFVVFPIVAYLIWKNKNLNVTKFPQTSIYGIFLLCLLAAAWLVGYVTSLALLQHLSFIAMIPTILLSLLGGRFIKNNVFPLAYLFFAVPMGEFLIPTLQDITASISVYLLRLSDIPVVLEGRYFYIPSGSFEVAKACSGIRYLIATLAVGSLYAYFMYVSFWRRFLFMCLTVFLPIIANGIRAYGIVMLANYSNYKYAVGVDHIIYGWVFFGVVIFLLFWFGSFWHEPIQVRKNNLQSVTTNENITEKKDRVVHASLILIILMLVPLTLAWMDKKGGNEVYDSFAIPTLVSKGWEGPYQSDDVWQPHFKGATNEYRVQYSKAGKKVEVYLAYYTHQQQNGEMINSVNRFYDDNKFVRKNEFITKLKFGDGAGISVRTRELKSETNSRIMYDWYLIGYTPTVSTLYAKLLEGKSIFFREKNGSIAVAITAEVLTTVDNSIQRLNTFAADFYPLLLTSRSIENQNVTR